MKQVVLEGGLGERFGSSFNLDVASPREALIALSYQIRGFRAHISTGAYYVVVRRNDEYHSLGAEHMPMQMGAADTIHIVPQISGAGFFSSLLKIVVGIVIVVVLAPIIGAVVGTGFIGTAIVSSVKFIGTALILQGVASILGLTPKPRLPGGSAEEQDQAHIFNGPLNHQGQGRSVPIACGRIRVGSIVVSSGVSPEKELLEPKVPGSRFSPTAAYLASLDPGVAPVARPSPGGTVPSQGAGESGGYKPVRPVARPSINVRDSRPVRPFGDRGKGGSGSPSGSNPAGTTGSGMGGFSR